MSSETQQPPSSTSPSVPAGYKLAGEIARGTSNTLELMVLSQGQRGVPPVVLKQILPEFAAEPRYQGLIAAERALLAIVHHPCIVATAEIGSVSDGALALEYIEGDDLQSLLATAGQPPPGVLAAVLSDILRALEVVHTAKARDGSPLQLVHQAVRSRHIMVGVDGRARLLDFAQAAARGMPDLAPRVDRVELPHMAPEQLVHPDRVDARADLFAVGLALWEGLTGERLFAGKTRSQTAQNLMSREVDPPSTAAGRHARAFDQLCMRALERDPERRFQSASEMLSALQAASGSDTAQREDVGRWVGVTAAGLLRTRQAFLERASRSSSLPPLGRGNVDLSAPLRNGRTIMGVGEGGSARPKVSTTTYSATEPTVLAEPAPTRAERRTKPPPPLESGAPPSFRPSRPPVANVTPGVPSARTPPVAETEPARAAPASEPPLRRPSQHPLTLPPQAGRGQDTNRKSNPPLPREEKSRWEPIRVVEQQVRRDARALASTQLDGQSRYEPEVMHEPPPSSALVVGSFVSAPTLPESPSMGSTNRAGRQSNAPARSGPILPPPAELSSPSSAHASPSYTMPTHARPAPGEAVLAFVTESAGSQQGSSRPPPTAVSGPPEPHVQPSSIGQLLAMAGCAVLMLAVGDAGMQLWSRAMAGEPSVADLAPPRPLVPQPPAPPPQPPTRPVQPEPAAPSTPPVVSAEAGQVLPQEPTPPSEAARPRSERSTRTSSADGGASRSKDATETPSQPAVAKEPDVPHVPAVVDPAPAPAERPAPAGPLPVNPY